MGRRLAKFQARGEWSYAGAQGCAARGTPRAPQDAREPRFFAWRGPRRPREAFRSDESGAEWSRVEKRGRCHLPIAILQTYSLL